MFHNYETEKITHKASNTTENPQIYPVVQFFHPRSSCTTHISADVQRITLNESAWWSQAEEPNNSIQLQVFCRVTGFMSDFLSFIVVELIRFFHRALQLWLCTVPLKWLCVIHGTLQIDVLHYNTLHYITEMTYNLLMSALNHTGSLSAQACFPCY